MTQLRPMIEAAMTWLRLFLQLALLTALAGGVVAVVYGVDVPALRALSVEQLAYLAGVYWLAAR